MAVTPIWWFGDKIHTAIYAYLERIYFLTWFNIKWAREKPMVLAPTYNILKKFSYSACFI